MSGSIIKTSVQVDPVLLTKKVERIINDESTMLEIHTKFAQLCNEYVPFLEGPLSQSVRIFPEFVQYVTPYAHYQYVLHNMNEDLAGTTNRTRIYHPKATSYWDKAMMLEKGDLFCIQVENILKARIKKLNDN